MICIMPVVESIFKEESFNHKQFNSKTPQSSLLFMHNKGADHKQTYSEGKYKCIVFRLITVNGGSSGSEQDTERERNDLFLCCTIL